VIKLTKGDVQYTRTKIGVLACMRVGVAIDGFENARTLEELRTLMQFAIESFGFCAYNFFDAGKAHLENPLYFGTTGDAWENEYKSNNFVVHDHVLSHARRTNVPFRWTDVPVPISLSKKKPSHLKLMEAARDHGFEDGYLMPLHFVDEQSRSHTALVALFWKDKIARLDFALEADNRHKLHLVLMYWVQRVIQLTGTEISSRNSFASKPDNFKYLTDRERECLTWAGRGLSVVATAEVLGIGELTAKTHLINATEKLEALNKTHAVAKAVHLGLIDL
jgi:LuxR family transcriptional regulator, quorum-sensing system regulator BjaR1